MLSTQHRVVDVSRMRRTEGLLIFKNRTQETCEYNKIETRLPECTLKGPLVEADFSYMPNLIGYMGDPSSSYPDALTKDGDLKRSLKPVCLIRYVRWRSYQISRTKYIVM